MVKLKDDTRAEAAAAGGAWRGVLRSRVLLCRLLVCGWCWAATSFVYYGLTINSVSLSGNKHVNFALNMSMEIAASVLIMMALERVGRKLCIFIAFLLCGVACVSPYFIGESLHCIMFTVTTNSSLIKPTQLEIYCLLCPDGRGAYPQITTHLMLCPVCRVDELMDVSEGAKLLAQCWAVSI